MAHRGQGGFTLLEMLVVFGIFAVIGMVSSQMVSRVIDNQRMMSERGARLAEIHRAMQIIQRDVLQLAPRPIRDELGDSLEPLRIGADGLMEFTRFGWRNPLSLPRSELQRVAYVTRDGDLYRAYWPVLDRAPGVEPALQALLSGVRQVEFYALDVSGNEHSFWPLDGDLRVDPNARLAGIVLRLDVSPFGVVERLWSVPSPAVGVLP